MLVRRSVLLAVVGVLAAAACRDVEQRDPAPVLALAAFDPGQYPDRLATIPFPNDLGLRGAPYAGPLRDAFLDVIDDGGWRESFATWAPFPGIAVPVWAQAFNAETGAYALSEPPTAIATDTFTADTVVLLRVSDDPPTRLPAAMIQLVRPTETSPSVYMLFRPLEGTTPLASIPAGRYVFALRGGRNGVHALFDDVRVPLEADRAIAVIAPNRDLDEPANRPPKPEGVTDAQFEAQMDQLEALRSVYALPFDWGRVDVLNTCVNGVPVPEALYPGRCWLPSPAAVTPAFAAVDQYFPIEEIASIQTFEVIPGDAAVREEVTP